MCPTVTAAAAYTDKKVDFQEVRFQVSHDKEMLCVSVFDNKFLNIGNTIGATGQTYCEGCKWLINFSFLKKEQAKS